jgi:phosphate acyltransferase
LNTSLPIALDAMGGDHAPASVIEGASIARRKFPELSFIFYGDEARIAPLLDHYPALKPVSRIVHTDVVVAADAKPSVALRQSKNSSMRLAIEAVEKGEAQAVVSAGNTGALMAISKLTLRMLPGINRPAIASVFPSYDGSVVMLDLGANLECSAEDLFQFAIMGDAYARAVLHQTNPRIGLLNVGTEESKGHPEIREAAQMLRDTPLAINFQGFVEGNDVPLGKVDVVVADGFGGNIMLKTAEGTAKLMTSFLRDSFRANKWTKLSYLIASKTMGQLKKKIDPRRYNGAMFLGLNGVAVKSHGGADSYAFYHAIKVAAGLVQAQTNRRIIEELQKSGHMHIASNEMKTENAL